MNSCHPSSPIRRLAFAAFSFVALMGAPAAALSPEECDKIRAEIKYRERPMMPYDVLYEIGAPGFEKEEEKEARDELKASGCFRMERRNDPECLPIYQKVAAAAAERRARIKKVMEEDEKDNRYTKIELQKRLASECSGEAARRQKAAPVRAKVARRPRPAPGPGPTTYSPGAAAIVPGMIGIMGPGIIMPRGPGSYPRGPSRPCHHRPATSGRDCGRF